MATSELLKYPGWLCLVYCGIIGCIECFIAYKLYSQLRIHRVKRKLLPSIGFCCMLACILYTVYYAIASIYQIRTAFSSFNANMCFMVWTSSFFIVTEEVLICSFYTMQLYSIFLHSAYSYSKRFIQIFIAVIIALFVLSTLPANLWVALDYNGYVDMHDGDFSAIRSFSDCAQILNYTENGRGRLLLGLTISFSLGSQFLLSFILLRLYLRNLLLLSLTYGEIEAQINKQALDKLADKDQRHHRKNALFLSLAIKTTNIVLIAVFSSLISLFIFSGRTLGQYWKAADHLIHCVCIYMTFNFGDAVYYKVCVCQRMCYPLMMNCCFCCCMTSMQTKVQIIMERLRTNKKSRKKQLEASRQMSMDSNCSSDTETIVLELTNRKFTEFFNEQEVESKGDLVASKSDLEAVTVSNEVE